MRRERRLITGSAPENKTKSGKKPLLVAQETPSALQVPSKQTPLHSSSTSQAAPVSFLSWQVPPSQNWPVSQASALPTHSSPAAGTATQTLPLASSHRNAASHEPPAEHGSLRPGAAAHLLVATS